MENSIFKILLTQKRAVCSGRIWQLGSEDTLPEEVTFNLLHVG